MRPRRSVFATSYIQATVDEYVRVVGHGRLDPREAAWARDVLNKYFQVVQADGPVSDARRDFLLHEAQSVSASAPCRYPHVIGQKQPPVVFGALRELMASRKSVRWFLPEPVDRRLVAQALEAAITAPSSCNRQSYRFVILDDPIPASAAAAEAGGTAGFAHNIPCLVVVVGDLAGYAKDRDRHSIYVDASLASMQLMLALEALGLSSCPINWPAVESRDRRMRTRLNLHRYERVVMLLAVGWADPEGQVAYSERKSLSTMADFR